MFRFKFVLHACIYISIYFLMSEETDALLTAPAIVSTGACPPKGIISFRSASPAVSNTSLNYTVVCCGQQNILECFQPPKHLQKLKALQCCAELHYDKSGWLTCDATNALGDIYKPEKNSFFLYASYVVTNGTSYIGHSRPSMLNLKPRKIVCTKPVNFTITLTNDSVILTWGMSPRMDCLYTLRFKVQYFPLPDGCSDEEDKDNIQEITHTHIRNSSLTFRKVIPLTSLKPRRRYKFELKCDVFGDKESAAVVKEIRTPSRVPRERPKFVKTNSVYFGKRRNITLSWETPNVSCPSKWGSKNDCIQLYIDITSQNGSNVRQKNNKTKLGADSSNVVISNVNRYQSLKVSIAYCNEIGCGPETRQVIKAEPELIRKTSPLRNTEPSNTRKYIITAAVIGGCVAIVCAVGYIFNKRRNLSLLGGAHGTRPNLRDFIADIGPYSISHELRSRAFTSKENVKQDEFSPLKPGEEMQSTSAL